MTHSEILNWLQETDEKALETLWHAADDVRRHNVGDGVHLRGLIEISSHCRRQCHYCGLRASNAGLERYRMSEEEILQCAQQAVRLGYGTVVLQSGEDPHLTGDWVGGIIRRIKAETPLAITLSLGEREDEDYVAWRLAGADRYLLRFETSNHDLYDRIHPSLGAQRSDRFGILRRLRDLGYQIGSGVMVGIPSQTYDDLARDVEMFEILDLDMIGLGPYIPHGQTPLGQEMGKAGGPGPQQVPNTELMTYKMLALARQACPRAHIPSTTALATLNKAQGRELGLMRGANVVMPNVTPTRYRRLYEIYPAKACIYESADDCGGCIKGRILSLGRSIAAGRGDSPRYTGPAERV